MGGSHKPHRAFQAVPFTRVYMEDGFWAPRIEKNRLISLPYQYEQLVTSGVLDNFRRVLGWVEGEHAGPFWMDSDAYKWLEAAGYTLATGADPWLQSKVDEVAALIALAQEPSGYLDTYFQLVEPEKKFTNLGMCHELYCAGHLIQAAVANHRADGGGALLMNTARRLADHLYAVFGPGRLEAADGHEEIETALVDLYRATGEERYLKLSRFFLEQRGKAESRFRWELAHLEEIAGNARRPPAGNQSHFGTYENYDGRYAQDHLPVLEQSEVVGHAVRAMYLYCAMADIAAETGDQAYLAAMERLWQNVVSRRMYITGGIGPTKENEGFTSDYDLPNETAYAETCAAVGMIMWNHRLLQMKGESRFADVMERVLYNGFLAGVSLDGRKFFYDNPLQSAGGHHRRGWFECACCPPNMARLLASLGSYLYSEAPGILAVHLYIQSSVKAHLASGEEFTLHQETKYPWEGRIRFKLDLQGPAEFSLLLRIPGWCRRYALAVNGQPLEAPVGNGYARLTRRWLPGDLVELDLAMPVETMIAHPAVSQDLGRAALQRGPLVYCLEEADHPLPVTRILLPRENSFKASFAPDLLGGVTVIEGEGFGQDPGAWGDSLYRPADAVGALARIPLRAVPYYAWDNRTPGSMAVWLPLV